MTNAVTEYKTEFKDYNGTNMLFIITPEGEHLTPVKVFADYYSIPLHRANEIITRNRPLFLDKVVKVKIEALNESDRMSIYSEKYRMRTFDCLTIAGSLQWINLLAHDKYFDDRREIIINMKNWLVELGASIIQGRALGQVPRGEVRIISAELTNKIKSLLKEKIVDKYEDGEDHSHIYMNEFKMLNRVCIGEHERGIKEKLNSAGLQVHNTGQVADIALLHANVIQYQTRKDAITATIKMVHSCVDKATLKLTESERARITRKIPKTQQALVV